ncbi:MAG: M28 family peptidase [Candidatus Freyarchaeota archaeon]|nr:M28 family peptidase [Candidatus Freyrarchaeum guaymaensis]
MIEVGMLIDTVKEICSSIGPRPAGSEAEARAAELIRSRLESLCDEVVVEEFRVHPRVLQGLIVFMAFMYLAAFIVYFLMPPVAFLLGITSLLTLYLSRMRGKAVLDWMFPEATSQNVIGKIKPRGEAKRILVFSGHHDSAYLMPLFWKHKPKLAMIQNIAVGCLALLTVLSAVKSAWIFLYGGSSILEGPLGFITRGLTDYVLSFNLFDYFMVVPLVGLIVTFYFMRNMVTSTPCMGANDNLSAVAVILSLAEEVSKRKPKNTEVWIVSFGSEEPSTKGSKFFAETHKEIADKALVVNLETVGQGEIGIISKEKSVGVTLSKEVVNLILEAGERAKIPVRTVEIGYGNTDASSLVRGGIKAATIFGMDENELFTLWHTPEDVPENLDEENLQKVKKLCMEILRIVDSSS